MWYWHHDYGWGWLGAVTMIVTMVLLWGGLITVVIILLRRFNHPAGGPDADKILDERFARGEIDEEELTKRRAALHNRT
ncbi:MAG: SHOCT domain-containing protein [Actinophytocola sp.]|uniref:SHOCT domain-containing protein n=1 Tax=Actinophytocola sp. TaxID=1872138 RepID=UPI0013263B4B|nr:SHOCT domain-containing protein [Actinophytocola sp.]MPZ79028.1 SHOCT domain-containing protein [Actinophytocola sp.]